MCKAWLVSSGKAYFCSRETLTSAQKHERVETTNGSARVRVLFLVHPYHGVRTAPPINLEDEVIKETAKTYVYPVRLDIELRGSLASAADEFGLRFSERLARGELTFFYRAGRDTVSFGNRFLTTAVLPVESMINYFRARGALEF